MELVDLIPEFNLYEEYWKIYTKNDAIEPLYIADGGHVERSIVGEGTECFGHVECDAIIKDKAKIKNILSSYNITFISQYKFNDLLGIGNRQLSYDFYLPEYNLLIEYQGKQHFASVEYL